MKYIEYPEAYTGNRKSFLFFGSEDAKKICMKDVAYLEQSSHCFQHCVCFFVPPVCDVAYIDWEIAYFEKAESMLFWVDQTLSQEGYYLLAKALYTKKNVILGTNSDFPVLRQLLKDTQATHVSCSFDDVVARAYRFAEYVSFSDVMRAKNYLDRMHLPWTGKGALFEFEHEDGSKKSIRVLDEIAYYYDRNAVLFRTLLVSFKEEEMHSSLRPYIDKVIDCQYYEYRLDRPERMEQVREIFFKLETIYEQCVEENGEFSDEHS